MVEEGRGDKRPSVETVAASAEGEGSAYIYSRVEDIAPSELTRLSVDYFNAHASTYDDTDATVPRRAKYLSAVDTYLIHKLHRLQPCNVVLSFGCGTGRREVSIAAALDPRPAIVGVEPAESMARIAVTRGITVIDSLEAPEKPAPNTVDAIVCLYSFPHLPSAAARLAALEAMWRMLRPGGLLLLDIFNLHDRYEWPSKLADGGRGEPPPKTGERRGDVIYQRKGRAESSFMHYFSVGEITSLLEASNFVITDLVGVGHGRHPGRIGVPLDEGCLVISCTRE